MWVFPPFFGKIFAFSGFGGLGSGGLGGLSSGVYPTVFTLG